MTKSSLAFFHAGIRKPFAKYLQRCFRRSSSDAQTETHNAKTKIQGFTGFQHSRDKIQARSPIIIVQYQPALLVCIHLEKIR